MSKFTIPIINIILSGYVVTLCLICLFEFDSWQDKTLAVIIIAGSIYIIASIVNRFLPTKMRLLGGVLDLLSGPLLIAGILACFALFEPWPIKIIGIFIWVIVMIHLPLRINNGKD
ncbi:hypothetical protein MW376_004190 [Citrobacter freundii]|nr:hypothetical protein [Citrobacter freundii]EJB8558999.1 hypothetical protein [Citrobacter freundii]